MIKTQACSVLWPLQFVADRFTHRSWQPCLILPSERVVLHSSRSAVPQTCWQFGQVTAWSIRFDSHVTTALSNTTLAAWPTWLQQSSHSFGLAIFHIYSTLCAHGVSWQYPACNNIKLSHNYIKTQLHYRHHPAGSLKSWLQLCGDAEGKNKIKNPCTPVGLTCTDQKVLQQNLLALLEWVTRSAFTPRHEQTQCAGRDWKAVCAAIGQVSGGSRKQRQNPEVCLYSSPCLNFKPSTWLHQTVTLVWTLFFCNHSRLRAEELQIWSIWAHLISLNKNGTCLLVWGYINKTEQLPLNLVITSAVCSQQEHGTTSPFNLKHFYFNWRMKGESWMLCKH